MTDSALRFAWTAPSAEEFAAFRAACGWGEIGGEQARRALAGGVLTLTCRSDWALVGLGRVIGDGALYFYLQDVIVHPDWRGQGIARRLVGDLLERLRATHSSGISVGLMAATGLEEFYAGFGFAARPNAGQGAGMSLFLP
ncbi:GNAT family N-acetyltransferase [Jannaschia pohangensis]|uniref:Acetyltransferase (GNAT) domain-containing protein n=1 Tax=Jannaschia pohangensis TaxID=390807 RepID=A0A1I3MRH2_9RHOB|nr:GNAT family N-acetyltransferase [Jannaschia pohangensis]SFI99593.1 Acetyltransferase (GNAT) domain-containing protein [Jannaschia pohangensis]